MKVSVKITKDELEQYGEYARILRRINDLCSKKCGRRECCGCPEHRELAKLLDKTGIKNYNESRPY